MDRQRTSCSTSYGAVRSYKARSFHLLLRNEVAERARFSAATTHRRALYRETFSRLQNNCRKVTEDGPSGQPETSARTHEGAWIGGMSTRSKHLQVAPRTHEIPLSFEGHGNQIPAAGVEFRHHVHPFARRLCLPHSDHRLVQPIGTFPSSVKQPRWQLLHRGSGGGNYSLWETRDLQYRPRGAVFLSTICRCCVEQKHSVQHGWQRPGSRQYLRGTTVEVGEI